MNNKLRMVLKKKYEAEIEDAKYKIECFSQQELIIPEHPDITGEVDKLLAKISSAEDKMAVMELHYDKIKAKEILQCDTRGVARVSQGYRVGVAKCMKHGSRSTDHEKRVFCDTCATPQRPLCDRGGVAAISYIYQC